MDHYEKDGRFVNEWIATNKPSYKIAKHLGFKDLWIKSHERTVYKKYNLFYEFLYLLRNI